MKTIIIINDIPLKQYNQLLDTLLTYIDYRTFDFPVTKFDIIYGLEDKKWNDFKVAQEENDYDYYIISAYLSDGQYTEAEQIAIKNWMNSSNIFPVCASLLHQAFYKEPSLKEFINNRQIK